MREGRYAVIFKRRDGAAPNANRKKAGGKWAFSGCSTYSNPRTFPLDRALERARAGERESPSLIYDVKRMA